ncbi:hypothetical protein JTB14_013497 [Gonioctena quinquepunctata]|nr:hypothetical protein JTB14_013497 [Gonioctena quinquepunctata]
MPKKTMIAKICPSCKQQVPVARKSCLCGHFFFNARRIAREFAIEADYRRRTSRVRREKPNYYDALEYDKHIKKMKKRISECDDEDDDNKKDNGKIKFEIANGYLETQLTYKGMWFPSRRTRLSSAKGTYSDVLQKLCSELFVQIVL